MRSFLPNEARLRGAKKTINHRGFALAPSRFGFLELMYCPGSPAGVRFPKLALFFALAKMFRVSGMPERLGLDN